MCQTTSTITENKVKMMTKHFPNIISSNSKPFLIMHFVFLHRGDVVSFSWMSKKNWWAGINTVTDKTKPNPEMI